MLELVNTTMLALEVNKKEQAPLGQRIRAVGMCFYLKRGTLRKGITISCVGVATMSDTYCSEVEAGISCYEPEFLPSIGAFCG